MRAALPNALALEEHAEDTTNAGVLRLGIMKIRRQETGLGIAAAISQFRLQDPGSAGAHEHADALRTVTLTRGRDGTGKSVQLEAQLREPVVAAVIGSQFGTDRQRFQVRNAPDAGVKRNRLEIARRQSRSPVTQGGGDCACAGAQAVHY